MAPSTTPPSLESITITAVHDGVARYNVPDKLIKLDESRYEAIPAKLLARRENGDAYLTKTEVASLVDWKLSHGTFRPSLKALVNQNSEELVEQTTRAAFKLYNPESLDVVKKSLTTLTGLKGIGPATASLLLSVYDPTHAPFFSDELFRWSAWSNGAGNGWDRKIKYNMPEYMGMFDKVQSALHKLDGITAVDLEKAAYAFRHSESQHESKEVDAQKIPPDLKRRLEANASYDPDLPQAPDNKRYKISQKERKLLDDLKTRKAVDKPAPRTRKPTRLAKSRT